MTLFHISKAAGGHDVRLARCAHSGIRACGLRLGTKTRCDLVAMRGTVVLMGYLFGNSEPFPLEYDFLSAFDAFVTGAARAVMSDATARGNAEMLQQAAELRERSLEELEAFHDEAMKALEKAAPQPSPQAIRDYVRRVAEYAGGVVEHLKRGTIQAAEADEQQARAELYERRTEIRSALDSFMTKLKLPVDGADLYMHHPLGKPELTARVRSPEGLEAEYLLSPAEWQTPRKVTDFVGGLRLPVDVKRGWFSSSVEQQTVAVDDFIIGGFVLGETTAEIRLRRKVAEDDVLEIDLRRTDDGLSADVSHPGTPKEETSEKVESSTLELLFELWDRLVSACDSVLEERVQLLNVAIGGEDVIESDKVVLLIQAVVKMIAPTVAEVDERSPQSSELTLKSETGSGVRRELYVKKTDLDERLDGLLPEQVELFLPLGFVTEERLNPPEPPSAPPEETPFDDEETLEGSSEGKETDDQES